MANAIGSGTPIPTTKIIPAQNVSPVETYPTLKVRLKDYEGSGDGLAVINAHEFNDDLHEKVDEDGNADPKAKAKPFQFREELVNPDIDDNDLKELGPPKTKQEKDRLENVAKGHLANSDRPAARKRLHEEFVEVVGEDATTGENNLPATMRANVPTGPGEGRENASDKATFDSKDDKKEAKKAAAEAVKSGQDVSGGKDVQRLPTREGVTGTNPPAGTTPGK